MRTALVFLACLVLLIVSHAPWLGLPYWWDEVGQFVPQSLDLLQLGAWIPRTAQPNVHPPGIPAYIAAVWHFTGPSIIAARVAILFFAALLLTSTWLLGRELKVAAPWRAVLLVAVIPVVFLQSMMVQFDLPSAVWMMLALVLFLRGKHAASAIVCALLVFTKETGIAAPLLFAAILARERRWRPAIYFTASLLPLAAWLIAMRLATGSALGDRTFAVYNVLFPLHPVRLSIAILRRLYALLCGNFLWIGTLALIPALRQHRFAKREWRIAGALALLAAALVTLLGGAVLERYLVPVFPIVALAMIHALDAIAAPWTRGIATTALIAGCTASLWINPLYPFPLENNLAMADMVNLQQDASAYLESHYAGHCVTTGWPFSDALRRPEYGYTRGATEFRIVRLANYNAAEIDRPDVRACGVLIAYTTQWEPRMSPLNNRLVHWIFRKFYGFQPALPPDQIAARLGLERVARWERRGLWMEVLARPAAALQ